MNKRIYYRATALVAASAAALAGCSSSSDEESADGEIVWAIGGARSQPGGAHQLMAELWNEENPDNPVRIEVLPESADEAREQQALVLQAEGTEFDILGLDVIWTGEYAENGWLANLDDLHDELDGTVLPGPIESASWAGRLWAVPMNTNTGVLYYRTDLVDAAPQTWRELCDSASELSAEGIGGYIGQGARYEGFVVNWLEMYWSAGGDIYNEDQSEVLFDVDLAAEVTQFMEDAIADGCFMPGYNTAMEEESRVAFQFGEASYMRNWPGPYSLIADDPESPANGNTAISRLPGYGDGEGVAAVGGFNNAVSAYSERQDAAKEFLTWLATDEDAQNILLEASTLPVLVSAYEGDTDDPILGQLGEILQTARPRPSVPAWSAISEEIQQTIFSAVNDEMEPADAAQQVYEFLAGTVAE